MSLFGFVGKALKSGLSAATGGLSDVALGVAGSIAGGRTGQVPGHLQRGIDAILAKKGRTGPTIMPRPMMLTGSPGTGAVSPWQSMADQLLRNPGGVPGVIADSVKVNRTTIGPGGSLFGETDVTIYGPGGSGGGASAGPSGLPPRGYHLNKTGYFLKNGQYVAPGTRWVRNRRRNPLNPRALSRAMGRLQSAKSAASALSRISIRRSCPTR